MEKPETFLHKIVKGFIRFLVVMLILCLVGLVFIYEISFNQNNYSIVINYRVNPEYYYGINYVKGIKVWKIKEHEDKGIVVQQIYPAQ